MVSITVYQISQIKPNLDIYFLNKMRNQVNLIGKHYWVFFSWMVVLFNFGLLASIFGNFQLVEGRLGLSPRKWSVNRIRGVGWSNGF